MLLDIVEVATRHNGRNLAEALAGIFDTFGVIDKVSSILKMKHGLTSLQLNSLGGDSASANNAMVEELAKIVIEFPGEDVRVRCFLHILNLVVKSILRQFDKQKTVKKNLAAEALAALDKLEREVGGSDDEEEVNAIKEKASGSNEDEEADNMEGWVDEREGMDQEEIDELDSEAEPMCQVLVKVSDHVYRLLIVDC